ncbi:MAG: hypothetical protein J5I93_26845, partial [Pirellulaceae bacterium]|nr:hypothetical protein [Pirellulaceae bacterium]
SPAGRERTAGSGPGRLPADDPRETSPAIVRDGSPPNGTDRVPRQRRPLNWPSDSDADPDADSLAGSDTRPGDTLPGGTRPGARPAPRMPQGPEQVAPPPVVRNNAPPGRNPNPAGPRDPRPVVEPAGPRQVALVAWTEVQGVAGDKRAGSAVWSGIHGRSASELWHSNVRSELLTLPSSRVTGVLPGGPRIIADADSLIEMAAAAPPAGATASDLEPIATPRIAVRRGRLAIDGLPSGRRIQVQLDARILEVEATLDDSTLAIERVAGETVIAAYHGRVLAGGQEFTRRAWGRVAANGELAEFRPQRTTDWYRAAAGSPGLPADLCLAFNNASNLVQVASRFETSADPTESSLAAQVALRCLAVEGQPISPALLGRLTNSGQESHRLALIEWLLARYRENAAVGDADLQVIGTSLQIAPRTTAAMSGWFQSAVLGRRPETAQLTELVTALRDPSVFTRQCGKYFLQHILNDPLVEFDPSAPLNRASISLVSRKVRDWQVAQQ